jgi:hypothetical protein
MRGREADVYIGSGNEMPKSNAPREGAEWVEGAEKRINILQII